VTLDDGFRNQAEIAAPVLRRHQVPAMFFISSRHSTPRKYLWFSYLEALEKYFRGNGFYVSGEFVDMTLDKRNESMRQLRSMLLSLRPHPAAMYQLIDNELPRLEDFVSSNQLANHFTGMSEEQVAELAQDFCVGIHTVDHPFLTKCDSEEIYRQILDNKVWLERISNQRCTAIAYPAGDYNDSVLNHCQQLEVTEGHALIPRIGASRAQELPRVGLYSKSLDVLGCKVQWGNWVRSMQAAIPGRRAYS
jgi:peptidoglycan/xylan/chitin deacetylase (PgdA/CDA1 family)